MTLKEEIEKILHPEKKKLHPPPGVSETPVRRGSTDLEGVPSDMITDSTLTLDGVLSWGEAKEWLLTNSSMDRVLQEFVKKIIPGFTKVDPRASMVKAEKTFREAQQQAKRNLVLADYLKKEKSNIYMGVMNEFKEKVQKIRGETKNG